MKRYLAYLLVAVMVLSLCACGADNDPADQTTAPSAFGSEPTNGTSEPETPTDTPTVPTLPSDPVPDATVPSEDNTDDNSDPTVPSEPSEDLPPVTEPDKDENQDDEVTPPEPTKPTTPSEPEKPDTPTNPPKEEDDTPPVSKPEEPKEEPTPTGCKHINTKFVEEIPPATCMEYGYRNATVCKDRGAIVNYTNVWYYSDGGPGLPKDHLEVVDDYGYLAPTPTADGYSGDKGCYTCGTIIEKTGHILPAIPYFVKMELVSVERPNAHYIDGVDMLTYMFGENKALQKGDSVTYRIVMSDGGNEGFTIGKTYGFSATLDGNLLTITATGAAQSGAWVSIRSVNESGESISKSVKWDYIIDEDGDISDGQGKMARLLKRYAKFLGFTVKDGAQMTGYTINTGGTMESLTGCTIKDNDDQIDIPGNSNWIKEVVWLFGEYKKLGFSNVAFYVIYADSFASVAD